MTVTQQRQFFAEDDMIFQDDNAPAHRAKMVNDFKRRNGITSLEWSGNSPELNPVENIWVDLKRDVKRDVLRPKAKTSTLVSYFFNKIQFLHKLLIFCTVL